MLANTITSSKTPTIPNTDPLETAVCTPTLCEDASGPGGTTDNTNLLSWVKPCDSCGAAAASVYCHADVAYLCTTCDEQVHVASRHERVPMCDLCEHAPAVVTCSADSATLCAVCDAWVHSANKLAIRHQRTPILPLPSFFPENTNNGTANVVENNKLDNEIFFDGEINEYLDLADFDSCYEYLGDENQQGIMMPSYVPEAATMLTGEEFTASYSYMGSMSQSVSFSSLEASVVPDTTITDISNSHLNSNGLDIVSAPTLQMHVDLGAADREARVMRYKEKKRMRKFEKTIRYASRKAYAEARPRIKGRFAKISEVGLEGDEMFSSNAWPDQNYGTMPWY